MKSGATLLAVCLGAATALAAAQPAAYRCGNTFSQTPCPDGKPLDARDTRSAAQHADAEALALQQRRQADQIERERHKRDASSRPAVASGFDSRPAAASPAASDAKAKKTAKPGTIRLLDKNFVAVAPASAPAKPKPKPKAASKPASGVSR